MHYKRTAEDAEKSQRKHRKRAAAAQQRRREEKEGDAKTHGHKAYKEYQDAQVAKVDDLDSIWQEVHIETLSHVRAVDKMFPVIRERWYWVGMRKWIQEKLKTCSCITRCKVPKIRKKPLHPVEVPLEPGTLFGLDMVTGLPETRRGNIAILTLTDYTSGKGFAYAMQEEKSEEVGYWLNVHRGNEGVFAFYITDNGKNLSGKKILRAYFSKYAKKLSCIAVRNPQANGKDEKFNDTLQNLLGRRTEDVDKEWDELMPDAVLGANYAAVANMHKQLSHQEVYTMRKPKLPSDLRTLMAGMGILQLDDDNDDSITVVDDVEAFYDVMVKKRADLLPKVQAQTKANQKTYKIDDHETSLKVGDFVLRRVEKKRRKGLRLHFTFTRRQRQQISDSGWLMRIPKQCADCIWKAKESLLHS